MRIGKKGLEELLMKYKDIIDVLYKHAKGLMALRVHLTNISN